MRKYQAEPQIDYMDGSIQVISLLKVHAYGSGGMTFCCGDKSPVAVLLHRRKRTDLIAIDHEQIDQTDIQNILDPEEP